MKSKISLLAVCASLLWSGCGGDSSGTTSFPYPPSSQPGASADPPAPSLSLRLGNHSRLLRKGAGQVLFPNLTVQASPEGGSLVVTVDGQPNALLLDPGSGPKSTAVLSNGRRRLTLTFTGATNQEINDYLRANLKGYAAPGETPRTTVSFQVSVRDGRSNLTAFDNDPSINSFEIANARALVLRVNPAGRVINVDASQEVSPSGGLQRAVDTVDGQSSGTGDDGAGSVILLESGTYSMDPNATIFVLVTSDPDLDYLTFEGPNRSGSSGPATLTLAGPSSVTSPILMQVDSKAFTAKNLDLTLTAAAGRMTGLLAAAEDLSVKNCRFRGPKSAAPTGDGWTACLAGKGVQFSQNWVEGCDRGLLAQSGLISENRFLKTTFAGVGLFGSPAGTTIANNVFQLDSAYSASQSVVFGYNRNTITTSDLVTVYANDFYGQAVLGGLEQRLALFGYVPFVRFGADIFGAVRPNYSPSSAVQLTGELTTGNFSSLQVNTTTPNVPDFTPQ